MSKCPYCESLITNVNLTAIQVNSVGGPWNGVFYTCPRCQKILSVAIDPIALRHDIVQMVVAEMKKLLRQ